MILGNGFEVKDEEYISVLELIIAGIFVNQTEEEAYRILSSLGNDAVVQYASLVILDIIERKYGDYLLDNMQVEGGIQ